MQLRIFNIQNEHQTFKLIMRLSTLYIVNFFTVQTVLLITILNRLL